MILYFHMSKQSVPEKLLAQEVSYKVGEECRYWLKFGEYSNQQAIEEGWICAQGNLTQTGLQTIVFEQEKAKKRKELIMSLSPKARSLKGGIKLRGLSFNTPSSPRTRKQTRSDTKRKYR